MIHIMKEITKTVNPGKINYFTGGVWGPNKDVGHTDWESPHEPDLGDAISKCMDPLVEKRWGRPNSVSAQNQQKAKTYKLVIELEENKGFRVP